MQLEQDALTCHASLAHNGDVAASKRELERRLDEVISFNRATVWREQAQFERNRVNVNVGTIHEPQHSWLKRPVGIGTILALAIAVFIALLFVPTLEERNQRNCLAMLVLLSILWCTEVIPLYVTSMLVPVLTVLLGILPKKESSEPMSAEKAAHRVFEVRRLARIGDTRTHRHRHAPCDVIGAYRDETVRAALHVP
jgi:phosphate transporter